MMNTQLLRKEIALQRTNLMFLAGIVLFWGMLFVASFFAATPVDVRLTVGEVVWMLNYLVVVPLLVILLPVMAGASAVSAERTIGTLDWQLSQPCSRREQWIAKSFVALMFALVSGGVLAVCLNHVLRLNLIAGFGTGRETSTISFSWFTRDLWPGVFAMAAAAIGLYASTLTRDALRALMGGVALLVLTFYLARIVIDPTAMLWPFHTFDRPTAYTQPALHYLVQLLLIVFILYLGLRNFRFERISAGRIICQLALWIVALNVTGWYLLKWEFNTRHVPETKPGSIAVTSLLGAEKPSGYRFYRNPVRLPGTNRIVTEDQSHVVEIDVPTGKLRQYPNVFGSVDWLLPDGKGYLAGPWVCSDLPIPLNTSTWIGAFLSQLLVPESGQPWKAVRPAPQEIESISFVDRDGVQQKLDRRRSGRLSSTLLWVDTITSDGRRNYLLRTPTTNNGLLELLDSFDTSESTASTNAAIPEYLITPDEKWYVSAAASQQPVVVTSVDHRTSYTLDPRGGIVVLRPARRTRELAGAEMGGCSHSLSTSKDGRYLFLVRVTPKIGRFQGREILTTRPDKVEFALLDLQSGKETTVVNVGGWGDFSFAVRDNDWYCTYPASAWSDNGKLAVYSRDNLFLCEPAPGDGYSVIVAYNIPRDISDIEFLNNETLLMWGVNGIWRADVPKGKIASIVANLGDREGVHAIKK